MISMDKKYKTRSGLPVRILCLDMNNPDYPVVGVIRRQSGVEVAAIFTPEGRFTVLNGENECDLIEVSPYEDFKIDEPVMVRSSDEGRWCRRHFAGVDPEGRPMAWDSGTTSFSNARPPLAWHECRRPTPEELAGK